LTWQRGESVIRDLIDQGRVEQVPASREHAEALLASAERHLSSAETVAAEDSEGAYAMLYDAARKALSAILANQGLRATARGGHVAVYDVVHAQLDPPLGKLLRPFQRIRVRRNEVEDPSRARPEVTAAEVLQDVPKVRDLIDVARQAISNMTVFR